MPSGVGFGQGRRARRAVAFSEVRGKRRGRRGFAGEAGGVAGDAEATFVDSEFDEEVGGSFAGGLGDMVM